MKLSVRPMAQKRHSKSLIKASIARNFSPGCRLDSNQIGKTYPWLSSLHPESADLARGLKRELDPDGLMNPGALGFPVSD